MAVILLILAIMLIITFVKLKDYESYDYIDEDEEYEGTDIEAGSQPNFVRASERKYEDDIKPDNGRKEKQTYDNRRQNRNTGLSI